jgi:stage V sporulation protein G
MAKKQTQESDVAISPDIERLQATAVQVYLLKEQVGKTKAFARVVLNDQLQLTGLRIVDGANGLFVSYPNDPGYKGEDYRSLFYPVTRELRDHIEQLVLESYQAQVHDAKSGK